MKKTLAVLSLLALNLPAAARPDHEINDLHAWRQEMRELRAEQREFKPVAKPAAPVDAKGCALMKLDEVVISRGLLSTDFTVEAGGAEIGAIEVSGGEYVIRNGGAVAARTNGAQVVDCSGAVIGSVEELAGDGASAFVIKDASGIIVATSGPVDGHTMVLKGTGGMAASLNNHPIIDSYKVSSQGIDARLAAIAVMRNNAALYRRSAERRRENMADRPHGRHDL